MKQYEAIIIDDEQNMREILELMLRKYCPQIIIKGVAASAAEGRKLLDDSEVDFIFLDISMPGETGFDFLNTIKKEDYSIVFVTAYEEFALRALKAHAVDYVLKPANPEDLKEAVSRAAEYYEQRHAHTGARATYWQSLANLHQQMESGMAVVPRITVADQYGFKIISLAEVMYLEADSNYTIFHLSKLGKVVASRTLGEYEKLLDPSVFFRIHKSTIINMNYLKGYSSYEGNYAELLDGTRLNIARRKLFEFRDAVTRLARSVT